MTIHTCTTRLGAFALVFAAGLFAVACDKSSNPAAPTPTVPTVSSVVVTGTSTPGAPFQMTATAHLTDATTRDVTSTSTWLSSNVAAATVSSTGMVTVVGGGELDVQATYQNTVGALHLLTATLPVVAVSVNGPSAATAPFQLTALARVSDGSTVDVTQLAHWQSSGPQWATVTTTGFVNIVSEGEVDFSATYKGVTGSLHVSVSLPRTYLLGGTVTDTAANGRPLGGARVQVFAGEIDHMLSDANGQFAFRVPAGSAIVEVTKDGYETWSALVDIGGDMHLAVALTPSPVSATPTPPLPIRKT